MFTVTDKSETSLTIAWGWPDRPNTNKPIVLTSRNQKQLLYQYVNHIDLFIVMTLDHIVIACDDIRKNYRNWGMGSLLNEEQTKRWWNFLAQKERWQKPDTCRRFKFEEILEFDFLFLAAFGTNVAALVQCLINAATSALAVTNKISDMNEEWFKDIYQKMKAC